MIARDIPRLLSEWGCFWNFFFPYQLPMNRLFISGFFVSLCQAYHILNALVTYRCPAFLGERK
jgi:hypothetical protein